MGVINLANGYSDYINYGFEPISSDSDFSIARLASGLLLFWVHMTLNQLLCYERVVYNCCYIEMHI